MSQQLKYSVTVQFNIEAGDPETLSEKLTALAEIGYVSQIKAKSAGQSVDVAE